MKFQGRDIMGNAKNTIKPTPTNTIVDIMINPSYEVFVLIAQLISMFLFEY